MAQLTGSSSRLLRVGRDVVVRHPRLLATGLLSILLLTAIIVACSSHTPPFRAQGIVGKGGGDPFWAQIANKSQDGGATSAIAWAESFETGQLNAGLSTRYSGLCLEFVANAYGASYSTPYDTAWALARAVHLNNPHDLTAAPQGALMFFDLTSQNVPEGHVGISLGGGKMISALEHSPNVQITDIRSLSYWSTNYRGWAWPPTNWGPLAKEAATSTSTGGPGVSNDGASVHVEEEFVYLFNPSYLISLTGFPANSSVPVTCYDSVEPTGFNSFTVQTDGSGSAWNDDGCLVRGSATGSDQHWVVAGGIKSNVFTDDGAEHTQRTGPDSVVHTWTDYAHAGGTPGPLIGPSELVMVACRVTGFMVADGNPWWYRISSAPWYSQYYASADAFYNNGQYQGSLKGTPWVDASLPICTGSAPPTPTVTPAPSTPTPTPVPSTPTVTSAPPTATATPTPTPNPTHTEQEGPLGVNTFTDPHNASGMGVKIQPAAYVVVSCKLYDPTIPSVNPDGYWYRIASSPWDNAYYAPANTFMNGDPWGGPYTHNTDFSVPDC